MKMLNSLEQLEKTLNKSKGEKNQVITLYMVMEKVGGYEQLLNLPLSSVKEIVECIEYEAKEKQKANKKQNRKK